MPADRGGWGGAAVPPISKLAQDDTAPPLAGDPVLLRSTPTRSASPSPVPRRPFVVRLRRREEPE